MNRSNKNYRGFTLIELIVAITIFSIIAVSIYSTFNAGIRMWMKTSPLIETNQGLRSFFYLISQDLKNAVNYYGEEGKPNFEADSKEISFVTLVNAASSSSEEHMELAWVRYYFEKNDEATKLAGKGVVITAKRIISTKKDGFNLHDEAALENLKTSASSLVDINVSDEKECAFEYCYKKSTSDAEYTYEWKETWDDKNKPKIPRGVRIKLGESKKTVFIPAGTLGE